MDVAWSTCKNSLKPGVWMSLKWTGCFQPQYHSNIMYRYSSYLYKILAGRCQLKVLICQNLLCEIPPVEHIAFDRVLKTVYLTGLYLDKKRVWLSDPAPFSVNYTKLYFDAKHLTTSLNR